MPHIRVYMLVEMSRFLSNSDLKQSITHAEKALEVAEDSRNNNLISYALFNAGNAYFLQGLYEIATGYFYRYLEMQKQSDNQAGIAFALANLGAVNIKMQSYTAAKHNLLTGLNMLKSLISHQADSTYNHHIPNILNNLGIVYQDMHEYDSALWYYNYGLQLAGYLDDPWYFKANIYNNIGGLYLSMQQPAKAFSPLQQALEVRVKRNDVAGQSASHLRLGEYYQMINLPQQASHHYYLAMDLAQQIGSVDLKNNAAKKMYEFYRQTGAADSALKYLEMHSSLQQKLQNEAVVKEITRLEMAYVFKEKQKLLLLEQKRLKTIYFFTAFLMLMLLIVFILLSILKNNRVKRLELEKHNLELKGKNIALEKDNFAKELEIRNKELATHVMAMIRKNETIKQIIEVISAGLTPENEMFFQSIIRDLNSLRDESVWEEFEIRYQQVHDEYYERLNQVNPHLTVNERRICAFLRLNMTTKDIATLTGQSIRSIEIARTRLRKKLNISKIDISLVEFLNSLYNRL